MVAFFVSTILAVVVYRFVPVYYTPLMFIRLAQQQDGWRLEHHWVPLSDISPQLPLAVMASEDAKFREHHGFDFDAIGQAAKRNREHPEKNRLGASTISQQTAKNVFSFGSRTGIRKVWEAYWTVLIELLWSKDRIMEVYLNVIEMGPGIYGAEAAAEHFFGCHADKLTRRQAVSIAICLPNPLKYNPTKLTTYQRNRCNTLLEQMQ